MKRILFFMYVVATTWVYGAAETTSLVSILVNNFENQRIKVPTNDRNKFDYMTIIPLAFINGQLIPEKLNNPKTICVVKQYIHVNRSTKPYALELTQIVYDITKWDPIHKKWLAIPFVFHQKLYQIEFAKPTISSVELHQHAQHKIEFDFIDSIIPLNSGIAAYDNPHYSSHNELILKQISEWLNDTDIILDTITRFQKEYLSVNPLTDIAPAA